MKLSEKYSVGDLVIIPAYTPAVTEHPETHQLVDFVTGEDETNFGIVTNIVENQNYGEITILCGNNFIHLPSVEGRPELVVMENEEC